MNKRILIIASIAILSLIGVIIFLSLNNQQLKQDKVELVQLEKENMQEELQRLSEEYGIQIDKLSSGGGTGEMHLNLSNDSLLYQLDNERAKVDRLQNELNSVKSSNARRISQLMGEVKTLRSILRSYVVQIDSLNAANKRLKDENKRVRREYQDASNRAGQLTKEKEQLTTVVERASRLATSNITIQTLNKRGRSTKRINRIESFAVTFTIDKNITATRGNRTVYMRILNPNDQEMSGSGTFEFEGQTLNASASKSIEYGGEATNVTIYMNVNETLLSGQYRVDLFTDGLLIGKQTFNIK